MDNAMYADDLGVVDTRIADGEVKREGLGKAKKVAVGAGALVAGAGGLFAGCKLAYKNNAELAAKWDGIRAAREQIKTDAMNSFTNPENLTGDALTAAKEAAGKEALKNAKDAPKESIFQKMGMYDARKGIFGEGALGKGNAVGKTLSEHWGKHASNLALKSAEKQVLATEAGKNLTGDALKNAAEEAMKKEGFNAGLGSKIFTTMSNYPILAAAGLAGAGFFIYKGIKKLINKRKAKYEEPSFAR